MHRCTCHPCPPGCHSSTASHTVDGDRSRSRRVKPCTIRTTSGRSSARVDRARVSVTMRTSRCSQTSRRTAIAARLAASRSLRAGSGVLTSVRSLGTAIAVIVASPQRGRMTSTRTFSSSFVASSSRVPRSARIWRSATRPDCACAIWRPRSIAIEEDPVRSRRSSAVLGPHCRAGGGSSLRDSTARAQESSNTGTRLPASSGGDSPGWRKSAAS